MFTQLVIGSVLFTGSLVAGLAPTPSTSDATITPGPQLELLRKQDDARYMGWWSWNGEWTTRECDLGGTYYQSSNFWRCCATTADGCAATDIPVGCISGSLIYSVTGSSLSSSLETWACTSIYTELEDRSFTVCNTGFMFENDRDSDPLTNVNCGVSSLRWSYYRVPPAEATAVTPLTSILSSPASTPAVSTPTSTSDFPTLISTPEGEEKKESKAWIAGAVVGPIVGLALIGLGVFFFLRRKKNKQAQPAAGAGAPPAAPPAAYSQQTYPPGPNSPPQYYPPPMQQNAGAPGMVPFGVTKHDSWAGQQTPVTQGSMSPNPQSPYGAPQQGWQGQNNMQINQAPSPSMSPQPGYAQPAQYGGDNGMYKHTSETVRPFSSELEGSYAGHGQPEQVNVQPKNN